MPAAGVLRAGKAVIEFVLSDKQVVKGLKNIELRCAKTGQSLISIGRKGAAAAALVGAPFIAAIKYASDAQESLSRFKALFGEQTAAAEKFADKLAKAVGRSSLEIKNGLGTFQAFFVGLGFSGDKSRELSEQLQALSIDFASFNNLSDQEALERFISALSGSSEVLDKFGINIKQVALQEKLLEQGVKKAWTEVTEQEKAMARLAIIAEAMGDQGAIGDAARTSGSFANQLKAAKAAVLDLAVNVGNALLPVVTPLLAQAKEIVTQFAAWAAVNADLLVKLAEIAVVLGTVSVAVVALGTVFNALATILQALTLVIGAVEIALVVMTAHPVIAACVALAAVIAGIALAFQDTKDNAKAAEDAIKNFAKTTPKFDNVIGMGAGIGEWAKRKQAEYAAAKPTTGDALFSGAGAGVAAGLQGVVGGVRLAASHAALKIGAGQQALSIAAAQQTIARNTAGQGLDDDIMRAQIDAIEDEKERRKAAILFESELLQRTFREQGLLNPENLAKILELEQAKLDAADADAAGHPGSRKAEAILDATFAGQQFGGGGKEDTDLLRRIASNTDPRKQNNVARFGN